MERFGDSGNTVQSLFRKVAWFGVVFGLGFGSKIQDLVGNRRFPVAPVQTELR